MTQKIERTLDDYLDRCFVYSVLLNKSHSYYSRLRTLFKIPIILTSSVMSLINSNLGNTNDDVLKIVNITFNLLTALILSLGSTLKIEEKAHDFLSAEKKFLKLTSIIEQKTISEEEVNIEFVNNIMNQYDNIVDTINYDVPKFICKSVRNEYATKKTLPLIINGVKKDEAERSPRISTFDGNIFKFQVSPKIKPMESSMVISPIVKPMKSTILFEEIIPKKNKATVLETKKVFMDIPIETSNVLELV